MQFVFSKLFNFVMFILKPIDARRGLASTVAVARSMAGRTDGRPDGQFSDVRARVRTCALPIASCAPLTPSIFACPEPRVHAPPVPPPPYDPFQQAVDFACRSPPIIRQDCMKRSHRGGGHARNPLWLFCIQIALSLSVSLTWRRPVCPVNNTQQRPPE